MWLTRIDLLFGKRRLKHKFKSNWPLGNAMRCPTQGMQMAALLSVVIIIALPRGNQLCLWFWFRFTSYSWWRQSCFCFISLLWHHCCDVPASKTNSAGCSVCTTSTRTGSFHQQKYGLYKMDQRKYPRNATFIMFFKFDMKICIDIDNVFKWIRFSSR